MKNKPVPVNLLRQNCFIRDAVDYSVIPSRQADEYYSLDEVPCPNGTAYELHPYPYPITPESVNSYVDSVDYKRDPLGAMATSYRRQNLGDIRDVQKLGSMDMESARKLYEQLQMVFSKAQAEVPAESSEVKQDVEK